MRSNVIIDGDPRRSELQNWRVIGVGFQPFEVVVEDALSRQHRLTDLRTLPSDRVHVQ